MPGTANIHTTILRSFFVASMAILAISTQHESHPAMQGKNLRPAPKHVIKDGRITLEVGIPYGLIEETVSPDTRRLLTHLKMGTGENALWAGESFLKEPCRDVGTIVDLGEHALAAVSIEVEYNAGGEAIKIESVIGEERMAHDKHALNPIKSEIDVRHSSHLPAYKGHVYLLRSYSMHSGEMLVKFRVEALDEKTVTLHQEIVKRWDKKHVEKRWKAQREQWKKELGSTTSGSVTLDRENTTFNFFHATNEYISMTRGFADISIWGNETRLSNNDCGCFPMTFNLFRNDDYTVYALGAGVEWKNITVDMADEGKARKHVNNPQVGDTYLLHCKHKGDALAWEYWVAIKPTEVTGGDPGAGWKDWKLAIDWKMVKVVTKPPQSEAGWKDCHFAPMCGASYAIYGPGHTCIWRD